MARRVVVLIAAVAFIMTSFATEMSAEAPSAEEVPAVETTKVTNTVTCTVEAGCSWEQWVRAIEGTYEMIDEICGDAGGMASLDCVDGFVVGTIYCVE